MNKFLCYDDVFTYNNKLECFELPPKYDVWFTDQHDDLYRIVSIANPKPDEPTYILYESACGENKCWINMFNFINQMHFVKIEANLPLIFWLFTRSNINYTITSNVEHGKATYSITSNGTVITGQSMLDVAYDLYKKVYS